MTQIKAFRVAVRLLGGGAYVIHDKRRGFVVGKGCSTNLEGVAGVGKTRNEAIRKAINKTLGVRF